MISKEEGKKLYKYRLLDSGLEILLEIPPPEKKKILILKTSSGIEGAEYVGDAA